MAKVIVTVTLTVKSTEPISEETLKALDEGCKHAERMCQLDLKNKLDARSSQMLNEFGSMYDTVSAKDLELAMALIDDESDSSPSRDYSSAKVSGVRCAPASSRILRGASKASKVRTLPLTVKRTRRAAKTPMKETFKTSHVSAKESLLVGKSRLARTKTAAKKN